MSRILKMSGQQAIQVLAARGYSHRWISRELGVNRRTVARYAGASASDCTTPEGKVTAGSGVVQTAKCTTLDGEVTAGSGTAEEPKFTTPEGKVTAGSRSSCALHAGVIEAMAADGLSAQRIWADLRAVHGFEGSYEAVKRFVSRLKARTSQRVWRVESRPGEEVQVDFMQGPMVVDADGKRRRTWILRMVVKTAKRSVHLSWPHLSWPACKMRTARRSVRLSTPFVERGEP